MFYRNNDDLSEQALMLATDPHQGKMHTDNEVRAVVEEEFSLMDQDHSRIRIEALAARLGARSTRLKTI